ncbi:MAG: hypothetical protein H7141_04830 [Burkholderiales bacterium]|nr:hypothetical protein [Bacteroidia bacterium]
MFTSKIKITFAFLLVFGLFAFISLNRHSHSEPNTYHSELWADKAGYNVYLPSLFIYDFNAHLFPKDLDSKTGDGFKLDSLTGKIITKYPYGVSLLQSPFWLLAHIISTEKTGYSFFYQNSIDIAGSFYLTVGLFFLFFTIRMFNSRLQSVVISTGIILSTGIFYYGIFETGMSHIYSFSCLSFLVFLLFKINETNFKRRLLFICFISILYIIIRPINILFLLPALLFFMYEKKQLFHISTVNFKSVFILILFSFLLLYPQLAYYKYAFGSYLTNSYQNEPFLFPSFSRIIELLFSANNGLLIYYPILIYFIFYWIKNKNKYCSLSIFLFISYILIYASWWSLSLGCGFGHRTLNDIAVLLFIPIFWSEKKVPSLFLVCLILCSLLNIKLMFSYDTCLYNTEKWNFSEYTTILFGEFK